MKKQKKDLRAAIQTYRYEFDLLQNVACTKEENAEFEKLVKAGEELPEDVRAYKDDDGVVSDKVFYRVCTDDLSEDERNEYLTLTRLSLLKTIKNCVMFFTILTIIGLVSSVLLILAAIMGAFA